MKKRPKHKNMKTKKLRKKKIMNLINLMNLMKIKKTKKTKLKKLSIIPRNKNQSPLLKMKHQLMKKILIPFPSTPKNNKTLHLQLQLPLEEEMQKVPPHPRKRKILSNKLLLLNKESKLQQLLPPHSKLVLVTQLN